jgi:hypothetical protein
VGIRPICINERGGNAGAESGLLLYAVRVKASTVHPNIALCLAAARVIVEADRSRPMAENAMTS